MMGTKPKKKLSIPAPRGKAARRAYIEGLKKAFQEGELDVNLTVEDIPTSFLKALFGYSSFYEINQDIPARMRRRRSVV